MEKIVSDEIWNLPIGSKLKVVGYNPSTGGKNWYTLTKSLGGWFDKGGAQYLQDGNTSNCSKNFHWCFHSVLKDQSKRRFPWWKLCFCLLQLVCSLGALVSILLLRYPHLLVAVGFQDK